MGGRRFRSGPSAFRLTGSGALALFAAVFLPMFLIYVRTLSPSVPFEDGGEMIRAAFTLGVTHPPGYSLYVLLGRLVCLVPLGDVAFRMNLLSGVASACACGITACAALLLLSGRGHANAGVWMACALAGWALGLGPAVWWQSTIAEKYAFNLFLNSLVVAALAGVLAAPARFSRRFPLLGLVFGVSAAHHGQTVYFIPAIAAAFLILIHPLARIRAVLIGPGSSGMGSGRAVRILVLFVLLAAMGLSVRFLYPPVRAVQDPVHNWLNPRELGVYLFYVTAGPYRYRLFYWDIAELVIRFRDQLPRFLPAHFSWPGVAFGLAGLVWLCSRLPGRALIWGAAVLSGTFYCATFVLAGEAIRTYYIPVFLVFSLFLARGLLLAWHALSRLKFLPGGVVAAAAILWVAGLGLSHRFESDRNRDFFAYDFSRNLLRSVEGKGLLICYEDRDLFPLWYQQDVLGRYRGVTLVMANTRGRRGESDLKEVADETRLVFPPGEAALARRLPFMTSLEKVDPGRPVFFSVVTGWVYDYPLLPCGAVYRLVRDRRELEISDVRGEWERFRRWRVLRGVFDEGLVKDNSASIAISYCAYGDYRRGFLLSSLGRCREAVHFFESSLKWPRFKGIAPAAARTSLARCLSELGDVPGAERELRAAIALAPAWEPALRALGALYLSQGRRAQAREIFAAITRYLPNSAEARRDLAVLRSLEGERRETR